MCGSDQARQGAESRLKPLLQPLLRPIRSRSFIDQAAERGFGRVLIHCGGYFDDSKHPAEQVGPGRFPGVFRCLVRLKRLDCLSGWNDAGFGEPLMGIQPLQQYGDFAGESNHHGEELVGVVILEKSRLAALGDAGSQAFSGHYAFSNPPFDQTALYWHFRILTRMLAMRNNSTHAMFPDATHDEQSQQNFIKSLRVYASRNFHSGNKQLLADKILPEQQDDPGRRAIRVALRKEPHNQWWGSMMRTTQEMLYDTVGPSIERQLPGLIQRANALRNQKGSLTLNPDLDVPRYATAVDYHCKPGNYHSELMSEDVFAGAEFDRTFRLYSMGGLGPNLDDGGHTLIAWLKEHFPDFSPHRILDMGCTVGHSTLPYCTHFPDAEVHAIDVAAPCLRYGHARAVAMGYEVHFSQQVAERTSFADESFDLIVSHALLHETTHRAIRDIHRECFRLLAPGGLMIHMDGIYPDDLYEKYYSEWMAHYNNEPFLGAVQDEDFVGICSQAGFSAENVEVSHALPQFRTRDSDDKPVNVYLIVCASK